MNSFPAHRHPSRRTRSLLPLDGQLFQPTGINAKVEQKIKSIKHKQAAYYDRGAKV